MKGLAFCAALAVLILNPGTAKPNFDNDDEDFDGNDNEIEVTEIPSATSTPQLLLTSANFSAAVGESATLPCEGEFPDNVAILWAKIGTDLTLSTNSTPEDDRFQLVNRSSLRISALVPTDSGDYTCQIDTEPPLEVTHNLVVTSRPSHEASCPGKSSKWKDLGGNYCYIIEKDAEVTWISAVYQCFQEGGSLATLENIEEQKRIHQYLQYSEGRFYIGLWKHNEGSFEWVDKSTSNFRKWGPGEPSDWDETCVEINADSGNWNDIPCYVSRGYICSSLKNQSARDAANVCPTSSSEWEDYGSEYCYIIELYNTTTSYGAAARCSAAGGTLSSFHSVEEIAVIAERITGHYDTLYIGLRKNSDGKFEWLDRSPFDLDFWDSREPDGTDECGTIDPYTGQWNDRPCENLKGYVCSTRKMNPDIEATELPQSSEGVICGGDITTENGTIQSPNYPKNYDPNSNCLWKITVPENFQIRLDFQAFQLEYGASCEYDYVEVFDGHEPESTVLGKLCGSGQQQIIASSANKMTVKFSSDQMNQRSGFFAEFRKVPQCGGNIVAEEGVIQTRNYPDNYWSNDICTWKITVPEGKAVLLKFKAFETEESTNCIKDYVEVYDGHDRTGAILDRKCGLYQPSVNPIDVRSFGHKITVRFVSDGIQEYYGFLAEFQTVEVNETVLYMPRPLLVGEDECTKAIDYERGTLVSPNCPRRYRRNVDCTWTIRGPPGSVINLRFKLFELESSSPCTWDYVIIFDGIGHPTSLGKFCGTTSPGVITSSGNEITVNFHTYCASKQQGFAAVFEISNGRAIVPVTLDKEKEEEGACNEDIISDGGIIQSPNYPENYGPNKKCVWKITVPRGYHVALKFNDFRVEEHIACAYDNVLVRDGHFEDSVVLSEFCGSAPPGEIHSCMNKLMIEFHSDSSVEHRGFSAEFKKGLPVASGPPSYCLNCGGDINADSGTIESPNYPHQYGPNEDCTWTITVPENHLVSLKFESVDLEYSSSCSFDRVTVRDGGNIYSPIIRTICLYDEDRFMSSRNKMTLKFTSDDSFQRAGFKATFRKVFVCGENISAEKGVLQSPNITDSYQCSWTITLPEDYKIGLKVQADPKQSVSDKSFYVEIYDGPDKHSYSLKRVSSLDQDFYVRSRGHDMFVRVFSDGSNGLPRFYAEFEKVFCGGNIVADNGTITSPDYPDDYPPKQNCIWKITVPKGYKVLLTFQTFKLEGGPCNYDFVEVFDGHSLSGARIGRYCGQSPEIPDVLRSSSNEMTLKFKSDGVDEYQGFSARFEKGVSEAAPTLSEDIENMLRQIPNMIFENAIRKGKPSREKKKRDITTKRSLTQIWKKC